MINNLKPNQVIEIVGYQDLVEVLDAYNGNVREAAEDYYSSEWNYNNADVTSGMKCFEYDEILDALIEIKSEYEYKFGDWDESAVHHEEFDEERRNEEPVVYE